MSPEKSLLSFQRILLAFSTGLAFLFGANAFGQQGYPARPIRFIIPSPPGGGTDILAREIAQKLSESLGQQVVTDNRGGAGGIIGTEIAARARPDGYTILMAFTSHVINPGLHAKLPYDTEKDFSPITMVATAPNLMVIDPAVPAKSVVEFIAYARARPGQVHYASAGVGSASHVAGALFNSMARLGLTHVVYKGVGPALADVIGGRVATSFPNIQGALPHARSGKVRALAVTGLIRSVAAPDVPTLDESGVKGYEAHAWFAVLAPARTPEFIVRKLNAEIVRILKRSDVRERLAAQGAEVTPSTPNEVTQYVRGAIRKWAKVLKESAVRAE